MKAPKDNFSKQADHYAKFRPHYPEALYLFLFSLISDRGSAWDCGTGNGQVALQLADQFYKVYGSDISSSQLEKAIQKDNIFYINSRAEKTNFPDNTFGLITVAQAFHWFDFKSFFIEVKRVAKPGAVLAIWGYNLPRVSPAIDLVVDDFYINIVGPYWDPERKHIDDEYKNIPFPFKEIKAPRLHIKANWNYAEFKGYLNSWSSVQKFIRENKSNPVELIDINLKPLWRQESDKKEVSFPVFMHIGKIEK